MPFFKTRPMISYIFSNAFAHYNFMVSKLWEGCYQPSSISGPEMKHDWLHFYELELESIGRLVQQVFVDTKLYFRTSSVQVGTCLSTFGERPASSRQRRMCQSNGGL